MNPLSGSNRLPVSPRRHHYPSVPPPSSQMYPYPTSAPQAPPHPQPARHATFQRPFPVPSYLLHSSLYAERYYTTPNDESPYSALATPGGVGSSSVEGTPSNGGFLRKQASLSDALAVGGEGAAAPAGEGARNAPILLPTCWDEDDRCALLELSSDGLGVSFAGSAKYGDRDAAAIRANRSVPLQCGIYYFEVTVVDKGVSGYIGIGLSHRSVSLSRLPGWEDNSYGFHADDGRAFCCQGTGEPFGPTFTTGDVVGCGVDWTGAGPKRGDRERSGPGNRGREGGKEKGTGGRVFFTKNGEFLGYAFCNLRGKLYPTVGLRTPNESVRVNFGADPFKFDIDSLVLERKRHIQSLIRTTPPSPSSLLTTAASPPIPSLLAPSITDRTTETLQALVSSYLVHHGYAQTAAAFSRQLREERVERAKGLLPDPRSVAAPASMAHPKGDGDTHADEIASSALLRSRIRSALLSGHEAHVALSLLEEHFPAVLAPEANEKEEDGGVSFSVRARVFVEGVVRLSRASAEIEDGDGATEAEGDASMADDHLPGPAPAGTASPAPPISTLESLLTYGQHLSALYSSDARPRVRAELQAVLGLMAYRDPEREATGRAREVLGREEREKVAEGVAKRVLLASNLPPSPPLETLFRHTSAAIALAGDLGAGAAALVGDGRGEVLGGL
ncbi:hypothetical protein JCM11251_007575 [Rhodosporidiobolus azoricus]